jgi:zinc protease
VKSLAPSCVAIVVTAVLVAGGARASSAASDVTRATLPNGLRIVIVRDAIAPVVTTQLTYLVGADETPPGFPGMAHAQEHMMFRGSNGLTSTQISAISASLGGNSNADTEQNVTNYFFTVPAEDLELVLHIEAIRMRGVHDAQSEWNEERGAIEQEVSHDLSNTLYRYVSTAQATLFKGTPYAHDALGTRPSFDKTTGAMLKKFYDTWYWPNNAVLTIAGDVDAAKTLAIVKRLFGPIPSHPVPSRPLVKLQPAKTQTLMLDSDQPVAFTLLTYRMPGVDSPDYAASQILGAVLGSQRGDLYALGPQGKALGAGFVPFAQYAKAGAGILYAVLVPGSDTKTMIDTLEGILDNYKKNGVPAELVDAAKRQAVANAEFQKNSIEGLATAWAHAVASEGHNSPDDDIEAIKQVSVADVNRVLRTYLNSSSAVVGILNPKPAGKPSTAAGFGGAESFAPKNPVEAPLPAWAQSALASVQVPRSTLNPTSTILANGLRLIVQPEGVSPTVSVFGHIKSNSDLEAPAGKEGVDEVLGGMFEYGTTTRDRLGYHKALDDIAANASAGSDFSLTVLSPNFDRGMELLADGVLHPAMPDQAFPIVQKQTAGTISGEQQSPDYLSQQALVKALYSATDPQQRWSTPESVSALTLDDVKAYYAKTFRPDLTTIVVVGDITPEQAQASVQKWFGAWSATGVKPQTDYPPAADNKASAANFPATGRVQDTVSLTETTGVTRGDADYYALQLGADVLGGGFYSSRLTRDVRQKAGLVYFVSQTFNIGKTRSTVDVEYGCDPAKVSAARALIEKNLHDMQTSLVTPDELLRAKAELIRRLPLGESSESTIAQGLLGRSSLDLPLDEPVRAANRYLATTAQQIRDAYAKWVRVSDFVQIVIGPAPG